MKKYFLLFISSVFFTSILIGQEACYEPTAYTELDANNIRAGFMQSGALWWDGADAKYFAPDDGSGVAAIFAGGIWAGGIAPDSTVRVAAVEYGHGGANTYDYYPGPLHPTTGNAYPTGCTDWDKFFTIYHSEKEQHLADFADNGVIDNPVASIFGWPGRNNPYFSQYNQFAIPANLELAPFVDVNGDNIYDPSAGDYPDTKGDQAIWWVFNDYAAPHSHSHGDNIGLEIHAMAYAFQSFEPAINNATFYDFKVNYRGLETLTDFNFGIWTDVDLGCFTDDYIGFDEENDMAFYYNRDAIDGDNGDKCYLGFPTYEESIPMLGMKILNDSDTAGITSFTFIPTGLENVPGQSPPSIPQEYYYHMTSRWSSGLPYVFGQDGYHGNGSLTSFAFIGDPSNEEEWSMCSAASFNSSYYDRKTIMSTQSPTPLNPGDTKEYSYAVIFVPDVPHPCPSLDMLRSAAEVVDNFDCIVSDVDEVSRIKLDVQVHPNPAQTNVQIAFEKQENLIEEVQIIDLAGRLIWKRIGLRTQELSVTVESMSAGIYFLKIINQEGQMAVEKLIIR